jgi:hypothetical protein
MGITREAMELPGIATHGKFFSAKGKIKAVGIMIEESLAIDDGKTATNTRNHSAIIHAI